MGVCGVFASACMPECRCLWSPVAGVAGGQKTVGRSPAAGVASCCDSPSVGARVLKSWGISSVPGGTKSCLGLFSPLLSASCLLRGKRQSVSCSAALLFCPTTWAKRPGTVPSEKASQMNHLLPYGCSQAFWPKLHKSNKHTRAHLYVCLPSYSVLLLFSESMH